MYSNTLIETNSGILFDLASPNINDIFIDDIAYSLAKVVRFNGHLNCFYSTATHCCVLTDWVLTQSWGSDAKALLMLLHHGVDVYISDIPFGVRNVVPEIKPLKECIERAVAQRFNIEWPWPQWLLNANLSLILQEQKKFTCLSDEYIASVSSLKPFNLNIPEWHWQTAAQEYLQRFDHLCPDAGKFYSS